MSFKVQILIGVPLPWPQNNVPEGCLAMEGQVIPSQYTRLREIYGNRLPDMRNQFIRGTSSSRSPLSLQSSQMQSHFHGISVDINRVSYDNNGHMFSYVDGKRTFDVKKPNRIKNSAYWNGNGGGRINLEVPNNTQPGATFSSLEIQDQYGGETRPANIGFKWICIAG